jgi:hypothetical protein
VLAADRSTSRDSLRRLRGRVSPLDVNIAGRCLVVAVPDLRPARPIPTFRQSRDSPPLSAASGVGADRERPISVGY